MKLIKKKLKEKSRKVFSGRFGALAGKPGDLMKNLQTLRHTPGKLGELTIFGLYGLDINIHLDLQNSLYPTQPHSIVVNFCGVWLHNTLCSDTRSGLVPHRCSPMVKETLPYTTCQLT